LEVLIPLAPFCKKPMDIILNGITGEEGRDMTVSFLNRIPRDCKLIKQVDMIRTVTLPHLHLFGITDGLELQVSFSNPVSDSADSQIKKRGAAPLGGGQVIFKCPIVRTLKTLQFLEKGKIKKIRGVA
jgi:RNA 3'-terminal phosphate cyclase-like protein